MVNYATAKRTGPAGGIGDLKTREDFNRAADIAVAAGDRAMLMRIIAVRDKMFGGAVRPRAAGGGLAELDAFLSKIARDEALAAKAKPKRFASPLARQMASLAAECRRIASRADQARIAAALKVGRNAPGQLVLPYDRAASNGLWDLDAEEDAEDALYERHSSTPNDDRWNPDDDEDREDAEFFGYDS